jgi:hypothetical protein
MATEKQIIFDLIIKSLYITLPKTSTLSIVWVRGTKTGATKEIEI